QLEGHWRIRGGEVAVRKRCGPRMTYTGVPLIYQAEAGIRGWSVTGVQTCALPIFALVGGVIDAVPDHGDPSIGLKPSDYGGFVLRQYAGMDLLDTKFMGKPQRRPLIVAGHQDRLQVFPAPAGASTNRIPADPGAGRDESQRP